MTARETIIAETEKALEAVADKLSRDTEAEIQRCLDAWAARYPRHSFSAYQAHGMLSVHVSPSVGTMRGPLSDYIDEIAHHEQRGAIAALCAEVRELIEWHCSLEFSVSTYETERMHSKAQA